MKLLSCRIQNKTTTTVEGVATWPQREGERVHLLFCIVVTAPVFQLDTFWLNTDAKENTARRAKGATKKRKTKTHHTNNNKQVPFQTTNIKKNKRRVRLVTRPTSSCRIHVYSTQHTSTKGAVATERERESEYTYCNPFLSPHSYSILKGRY